MAARCHGIFLRRDVSLFGRQDVAALASQLQREGVRTNWNKTILMVMAITLHNIPEGLAVGIGFGAYSD
jgi:zinc transporter ZupT